MMNKTTILTIVKSFFVASVIMIYLGCSGSDSPVTVERTAALDDAAWQSSKWISAVDAPVIEGAINDDNNGRAADGASWFLSTVINDANVAKARWMTTSLGINELYVNGQVIGREVLRPGFTHHSKTKRSFTYDITPLLNKKSGETNVLAAQVTPGWWGDKIVTPWGHDGMIGKKCAFRGVLEITYTDGTTKRYGTNPEQWKAGIAGKVTHAAIFDGEEFDARQPLGFDVKGAAEENTEFNGDILPSDGAEVYQRTDLAMKPVKSYIWRHFTESKDGEYGRVVIESEYGPDDEITLIPGDNLVVDFGQNCAAVPSFVFTARRYTELLCLPGELLNDGNGAKSRGMDGPEGSVHRDNLRMGAIGARIRYTFAGDGVETYTPRYSFFGYRYMDIVATDTVTIKSIASVPVSSIAKELETGTITTGNELVNKLISNTVWGQRSNYLSVPTDCPQRNERLGWTADTQVFTETGTFFANTRKFFHKWMRDMRDSQNEQGGFPGVAPTAQYGGECTRLGWTDAGVIVPWTIWKQYADTDIINENWDAMDKFIQHISETQYDHQALIAENGNYQWADWLSYEPLESCGGTAFENGKPKADAIDYWNYLSLCYWAMDAQMMADMARATNRPSAPYETMAGKARQLLTERFLRADGSFVNEVFNTMQTPALFALKNHLVEGQAKENMTARLRTNFTAHGNCLQTGFLGTSILMQTLTDNGMSDIAYELLFQRKNPSWLYSIDNGATTIWERWNSYTLDGGMGPRGMNSFNHYAYGCVCQWLWQSAAGIATDTDEPGFRHIIMRPVPDKRLGHLDAEYQSATGLIKSSWHYEDNQWVWTFTIPKGSHATVILPGQTEGKTYESGSYTVHSS